MFKIDDRVKWELIGGQIIRGRVFNRFCAIGIHHIEVVWDDGDNTSHYKDDKDEWNGVELDMEYYREKKLEELLDEERNT